jgi:UDP-N-acetylmuramoylalanine--D-glutamate ligase
MTDLDLVAGRISPNHRTVGITGTNGKTTSVEWLTHILNQTDEAVALGNIGQSPARFFLQNPSWQGRFIVFELSSFQLHYIRSLYLDIGVLLNITPDHLSWHGSMELYRKDKLRIIERATQVSILQEQDRIAFGISAHDSIQTVSSTHPDVACLIDLSQKKFRIRLPNQEAEISFEQIQLQGFHNLINGAHVALSAFLLGADPATIQNGLNTYTPSEHRMEVFHKHGSTLFVNDSKATNLDATVKAIQTFGNGKKNIILLAGGCPKGDQFEALAAEGKDHVRIALLCGESVPFISRAMEGKIPYETFPRWPMAIKRAIELIQGDDVILFSPAGSSFDFFSDYAQRGKQLKKWMLDELSHK